MDKRRNLTFKIMNKHSRWDYIAKYWANYVIIANDISSCQQVFPWVECKQLMVLKCNVNKKTDRFIRFISILQMQIILTEKCMNNNYLFSIYIHFKLTL